MAEHSLKLRDPLLIKVETPDGQHSCTLDVFESWRFLEDSQKQPDEQHRWNTIRKWLAAKLGVAPDDLGENMLRLVHEAVVALGTKEQQAIVGELSSIASSQQPIPESR